jgi:hypothetical protein
MKKMNDENDFKMKMMKKVSLFPKKYWLKKHNDAINFEIKDDGGGKHGSKQKTKEGGGKEKNRMKVKMKFVNMLPSKFFFWCK